MHAYSKRFLQVLLVGIQMATYLVDACLSKLEFLDEEGSKNSEISLIGPNSHNNKVSIEIRTKNKQTEAEVVKIWGSMHRQVSPTRKAHARAVMRFEPQRMETSLRILSGWTASRRIGLAGVPGRPESARSDACRQAGRTHYSSGMLPCVACRLCPTPSFVG